MEISAKLVKELRAKTAVSWMQCKKALQESSGNFDKAVELLQKSGETLGVSHRNSATSLTEGLVTSYIHTGGRVGVLLEVNCDTDFVARNEVFRTLGREIAMQIAACPSVEYVSIGDIPDEIAQIEQEIEMDRDDLAGKPENIKEKIVRGRIEKRLKELCLMEQPYIRDQNITVEELVKQAIVQLRENIRVRRFTRYVLGEGIDQQGIDSDGEPPTGVVSPKSPAGSPGAAQVPTE
jgi:elongation factor Ts